MRSAQSRGSVVSRRGASGAQGVSGQLTCSRGSAVEVGSGRLIASAMASFCQPEAGPVLHADGMQECDSLPTPATLAEGMWPHAEPADDTLRLRWMCWQQGDGDGGQRWGRSAYA